MLDELESLHSSLLNELYALLETLSEPDLFKLLLGTNL